MVAKKAILVLKDGSVYEGNSFGAEATTYGEVIFNTSMTGYQELLTDPSCAGQILVSTYPLMGNYGINEAHFESKQIHVRGLVAREYCLQPSHWQSSSTLHKFLQENGIPGISEVDTRALTRHIRWGGVMMGILTSEMTTEEALKEVKSLLSYDCVDFVHQVSTEKPYEWQSDKPAIANLPSLSLRAQRSNLHIIVIDLGLKYNILRILTHLGCQVTVVPCDTSSEDILRSNPDGLVLSSGPGNPALLGYIVETIKGLWGKKPMMGICLGHQLIGRALGAKTFKLKFGHRGGNHPVRDLATGRVYITAQNHGYAIAPDSLEGGLEVSHINLNDGTVEGLRHRELPILAVQYHPEASPGPQDNAYLLESFLDMVKCKDA